MRSCVTWLVVGMLALVCASAWAQGTIKEPSKYRKPIKPLVGNVIFGNELPHLKEDEFKGVKNEFVLGKDKTIQARAYYPMILGELWGEVQKKAGQVLGNPKFQMHGSALHVKNAETGEEMFIVEIKQNAWKVREWDQQRVDPLMLGKEPSDFMCRKSDHAYEKYKTEFPFPEALKDKPGRYECKVEFFCRFEGETGDVEVSWDKWGEKFDLTRVGDRIGFTVARGTFTLVVPE